MNSVKKLKTGTGTTVEAPISSGETPSGQCDVYTESDHSDSGSDSSSVGPETEVQVDFEARAIEEDDYHGIRRLLQQLFLKADVDLSALTSLVLSQSTHYGSTIKVSCGDSSDGEGDDQDSDDHLSVCGVTTLVHLTQNQSLDCVRQLKEYLLSQCEAHSSLNTELLSDMLEDKQRPLALLINERVLNIPTQIGSLMLQTLLRELCEAQEPNGGTCCELVLVLARSHLVSTARVGKKRASKDAGVRGKLTFDYCENEVLSQESLLSFSYPVSAESDHVFGGQWNVEDKAMKPFRTAMILPYSNLRHAIKRL